MTLTKAKLTEKVRKSNGLSKEQSQKAVETFLELTKNCLIRHEDVLFSGFGKFRVDKKKERLGRNPQTGEELILNARTVVTFHSSGKLKERIS